MMLRKSLAGWTSLIDQRARVRRRDTGDGVAVLESGQLCRGRGGRNLGVRGAVGRHPGDHGREVRGLPTPRTGLHIALNCAHEVTGDHRTRLGWSST